MNGLISNQIGPDSAFSVRVGVRLNNLLLVRALRIEGVTRDPFFAVPCVESRSRRVITGAVIMRIACVCSSMSAN